MLLICLGIRLYFSHGNNELLWGRDNIILSYRYLFCENFINENIFIYIYIYIEGFYNVKIMITSEM